MSCLEETPKGRFRLISSIIPCASRISFVLNNFGTLNWNSSWGAVCYKFEGYIDGSHMRGFAAKVINRLMMVSVGNGGTIALPAENDDMCSKLQSLENQGVGWQNDRSSSRRQGVRPAAREGPLSACTPSCPHSTRDQVHGGTTCGRDGSANLLLRGLAPTCGWWMPWSTDATGLVCPRRRRIADITGIYRYVAPNVLQKEDPDGKNGFQKYYCRRAAAHGVEIRSHSVISGRRNS